MNRRQDAVPPLFPKLGIRMCILVSRGIYVTRTDQRDDDAESAANVFSALLWYTCIPCRVPDRCIGRMLRGKNWHAASRQRKTGGKSARSTSAVANVIKLTIRGCAINILDFSLHHHLHRAFCYVYKIGSLSPVLFRVQCLTRYFSRWPIRYHDRARNIRNS